MPLDAGNVILISMETLMPIPAHNNARNLEVLERSTLTFPGVD